MPRSKHRRKRPKAPQTHRPPPEWLDLPAIDPDLDPDFAAALAQAEEELAAELAADESGELDPDLGDLDDDAFDAAAAPLIEAVENQVRANGPPEVAAALARLMAEGHERDDAIGLIGAVLMFELNEVMRSEREFDSARYVRNLANLPALPDFD